MQRVPKFVEQRLGVVEGKQRRLACARFGEVHDVDDQRMDIAPELFLVAQRRHPGAAVLRCAGEIIAEEKPAVASGLVAVLGLFLLGDAAFRGSWDVVLRAAGPIAVLVWALWVLTYRPCIVIDERAVTVVNPLRRTVVPWQAVADVRLRWQIVIETVAGRKVQCWGGPSLPRPKPARRWSPR